MNFYEKNVKKINLLNLNKKNMRNFFISIGESSFRADQIMQWIYKYFYNDFDKMTNISHSIKNKLKNFSFIKAPKIKKEFKSIDGSIKWLMEIDDKQIIETIYIPEKNRATLCISSQVGCALKCKFCFTAKQGFNRNLKVSEIIGQIWRANNCLKIQHPKKLSITNIVIMGMGEPLLNFKNIIHSVNLMLDNLGFNFSKRRITLSTVGIVPAINKLYNFIDVVLAISLHAPNNKIRDLLVPINKKYNIQSLLYAAKNYVKNSFANRGRVTIEYVMLNNINDNISHAYELTKLLYNIPCKINLIPWNSIPFSTYVCSTKENIKNFSQILKNKGYFVTIRKNRGNDIYAACGQLKGKVDNLIKK